MIKYSVAYMAAEDIEAGQVVFVNPDGKLELVKSKEEIMREALELIANNPCLDPEGNADIAQKALERTGG